jgi:hypothetical protein
MNKTKTETLKEISFVLGLVFIGIVIGISYYIAYEAYSSIKNPTIETISWNTRDDLAIYSAHAEEELLQTDILVKVDGGGNSGQDESPLSIEDKIRKTFPENPEVMLAIAKAESKLNPHAINRANRNGSVDVGLFQINSIHGYDEEFLKNEDNNLKVARKIYDTQGITAWSAYNNGAYLKWL